MTHQIEVNRKSLILAAASVTILVSALGRMSPHVSGNRSEAAMRVAQTKTIDSGALTSIGSQQRPQDPEQRPREPDPRQRDSGQRSRESQEGTRRPDCRTDPQSPPCLLMRIHELTRDVETLQQKVDYLSLHELSGVVESLQQRVDNLYRTQASATQAAPTNLNGRLGGIEFKIANLERAIGTPPGDQNGKAESSIDDIWTQIGLIKRRLRM